MKKILFTVIAIICPAIFIGVFAQTPAITSFSPASGTVGNY
ncbi:MAG: hypothetical protein ABIP28_07605 [Mucilaginibacter sp.]